MCSFHVFYHGDGVSRRCVTSETLRTNTWIVSETQIGFNVIFQFT